MLDKYKAFLFDFDFTLFDSARGQCECVNYALRRMGLNEAKDIDILRFVGSTLEDTFEKLTGVSELEKKHEFRNFFRERGDVIMLSSAIMYPHVDILLKKLRSKRKHVAIVSTKYRHRIEEILSNHNIRDEVNIIIGWEDVTNYKPDPEGVFLVLKELGITISESVFIGDSLVDAEVSMRAGLDFIAVLSGTTQASEFEQYKPALV